MTKKHIIGIFFISIVMLLIMNAECFAANITANSAKGNPESIVTVSFTTTGNVDTFEATLAGYSDCLEFQGLTASNAMCSGKKVSATSAQTNYGAVTVTAKFKIKANTTPQDAKVTLNVSELFEKSSDINYSKSITAKISISDAEKDPAPNPGEDSTPPPTTNKSTDATLKSLKVNPSGMTPNFSSKNISYKLTVNSDVTKITVTAVPNNNNATYKVFGNKNLEEGTNIVKVLVTAESGATKEYKITVTRKAKVQNEENTVPNVLGEPVTTETPLTAGELGLETLVITGAELNPTFSAGIYEYVTELKGDSDTVEVIATANQKDAIVEIVGNTNLKSGENLITILVKSADGTTTKTYQILLNKVQNENTAATNDENNNMKNMIQGNLQKIILGIVAFLIIAVIIAFLITYARKDNTKHIKEDIKEEPFKLNPEIKTEEIKTEEPKNNKGKRFK